MQGDQLGPYRIEREVGSGGMGKVYAATVTDRAHGLTVGDRVALKIVHPHLLDTPGFFKRFLREAQIGQSVRHENVVRTLDCDAVGSDHFLVMEYVEGQTLTELLHELDKVPEELCRHIAREIAKGLAAIHAAGVVHRDLKPENVLITADHVVKVMDLGVARLTEQSIRLSQSGAFVGSVEYAAPEQFGGGAVDARCDLHALGLLLYELSCGQHPYRGDDFRGVMKKVCEEEPRRLGDIHPQLSPFFEEVVHTLLAKKPDGRFADASTLLAVLEEGEKSPWWRERARALQAATNRPLRRIRIPRETAVYGREKELERLRVLFEQAKAGDGQVVLIEGEAGIGKSRLVDELIVRLRADGEDLHFLFGSYPPGGAASAAGAFSSAYREHFGDAGSSAYLTQTPLLVPAFDAVLRGEPPPSGVVELTKDSLGTCFVHATRSLAADRPTVVLVDDLHFAPEDARSLFTSVALAVPGHRVLLVGTMRPGVPEDWVANVTRLDHASRLEVPRLGPKDLGLLLADSFKSNDLAHALGMQIAMKSDGNPFFAFEIIRGLREGQFITQRDDGTWVSTRVVEEIQIPSSVLDLVNARVADLTQEERDLLDVASCWGFGFDPTVVAGALGLSTLPALKCFGQIERKHRLVRSSGNDYVFDHHQVQEALYAGLHNRLKEHYHAALAEALESSRKASETDPKDLGGALCVDLCEHYLKGARGESALRYLAAAQEHLRKGYLSAQGIALAERALAVPDLLIGTQRAGVLLRLVQSLDLVGRRARQEECIREIQRLAEESGDDELRRRAETALGWFFHRSSRYAECEAASRRALDLACARADRPAEGAARVTLGLACSSQGRLPEAQEHYERALAIAAELGDRRLAATTIGNQGNVLQSLGRLAEAQQYYERHLALSRELEDREGEARATGNLGVIFESQGRIPEAQEQHERCLAHARAIGDRGNEALAMVNLGSALWAQGRLAEAREQQERCLALSRELGDRHLEAGATANLGLILCAQDRLFEAQGPFERALVLFREIGHPNGEVGVTANLGNIHQLQGRLPEALEHHERALARSRAIGYRHGEASAHLSLAGVLREQGESERSEQHLLAGLALCEVIGNRRLEVSTRLALGSLRAASGAASDAQELLAATLDLARELGSRGDEVKARCELALLPGGDAADALTALAEHEERLDAEERREARLLLWKATGDKAHLTEARRLLDEALSKAPAEFHESMCRNLRVNREILAAWRGESGADGGADDASRGTGSVRGVE